MSFHLNERCRRHPDEYATYYFLTPCGYGMNVCQLCASQLIDDKSRVTADHGICTGECVVGYQHAFEVPLLAVGGMN